MLHSRWLTALLIAAAISGCASLSPAPIAQPTAQAMVLDRLYFGRTIGESGRVSDAQWADFLVQEVTPRFPAGLTVLSAQGQWLGESGAIVREDSFVLELLHPDDDQADAAIAAIAQAYKQRHAQEAVMWVRSPAYVSF